MQGFLFKGGIEPLKATYAVERTRGKFTRRVASRRHNDHAVRPIGFPIFRQTIEAFLLF